MVTEQGRVKELLSRLLQLTQEGKLQWRQIGSVDYESEVQDEQGRIRFLLTLLPVPGKPLTSTGRMRLTPEWTAPYEMTFRVEPVSPTLLLFEPQRDEPILRIQADELDEENRQLLERLYELLEKPSALEGVSFMERALKALERVGGSN